MEAHNVADRTTLRALWRHYPDWPARAFAEQLGRSLSWVRKWLARFRAAPEDDALLWGRSRARHHPPPPVPAVVVARILEIRDQPPDQLQRTPGPKAILY
jgi:transposase